MFKDIRKEAYEKSVELLLKNSTEFGLMASTPGEEAREQMYVNIFARDASISSMGMVASKNKDLIEVARKSLTTLSEHQTSLGQIPSSISPDNENSYFYYLGSIDSTLWWLIAVDFYDKHSEDNELKKALKPKIEKAINWLFYQDTNNDGLLEQGEASDWADYMPNNGAVLYTNVLWYRVLHLYGYEDERELALDGLNSIFLPHQADASKSIYLQKEEYRGKTLDFLKKDVENIPCYLQYISYRYASDRCDVFANSLAILFNVSENKKSNEIIRYIINKKANKKYPVKILFPEITKKDQDYREYLDEEPSLNKANCYHNGGIWPFVGGFWIIALEKAGQHDLAKKELRRLAELNKKNNWEFNEWFNSKNYKPLGMKGQSWNAAMYILAYHVVNNDIKL
ncbi:MAG: glycoside hydrolase [Patescibacteria group bacterium]|jgi:hypothetical protein|nr:glycoside hydrolase [Patescibacteria group bacterium]